MRRFEGEPQKKPLLQRAWERIARRGRSEPSVARTTPGEPIIQQPEIVTPNSSPIFQQMEQYLAEDEQVRQAALRREQEQQRQAQEARRQQDQNFETFIATRFYPTMEQFARRKVQADSIGRQTCQQLEQEIQERQIDQYAAFIQNRMWANLYNVSIARASFREPAVTVKGTVKRSFVEYLKLITAYEHEEFALFLKMSDERLARGIWWPEKLDLPSEQYQQWEQQEKYLRENRQLLSEEYGENYPPKLWRSEYKKFREENKLSKNADQREVDNKIRAIPVDALPEAQQAEEQVINRSKIGRELSYSFDDWYSYSGITRRELRGGTSENETVTDENYVEVTYGGSSYIVSRIQALSFGIGYFTDRSQIIPQAQPYASDEEVELGVKAFFIQQSESSRKTDETLSEDMVKKNKEERERNTTVIPVAYPEARQTFEYLLLRQNALNLSPRTVIPQAHERIRTHYPYKYD